VYAHYLVEEYIYFMFFHRAYAKLYSLKKPVTINFKL